MEWHLSWRTPSQSSDSLLYLLLLLHYICSADCAYVQCCTPIIVSFDGNGVVCGCLISYINIHVVAAVGRALPADTGFFPEIALERCKMVLLKG